MAAAHDPPFVAVAGNIGTGKTGLVHRLARALQGDALPENTSRNPYFDRFYDDPDRWAFHSQMAFAVDSMHRHALACASGPVVQDRTIYESVDVFARLLAELGHLSPEGLDVLDELLASARLLPRQPTTMIYLHAPPHALLERTAQRDRPAERHLTVEYLQQLHDRYEDFIANWAQCPVIAVDTTQRDLRGNSELAALLAQLQSAQEP